MNLEGKQEAIINAQNGERQYNWLENVVKSEFPFPKKKKKGMKKLMPDYDKWSLYIIFLKKKLWSPIFKAQT